jgi:hypothetical protein
MVLAVMGVALFFVALGMLVSGLTMGSSYDASSPPPNIDQVGRMQIVAAAVTGVIGVALVAGSALLFGGTLAARRPTAVVGILAGLAAIVLAVVMYFQTPSDLVLPVALAIGGLVTGIAGIFLVRAPA